VGIRLQVAGTARFVGGSEQPPLGIVCPCVLRFAARISGSGREESPVKYSCVAPVLPKRVSLSATDILTGPRSPSRSRSEVVALVGRRESPVSILWAVRRSGREGFLANPRAVIPTRSCRRSIIVPRRTASIVHPVGPAPHQSLRARARNPLRKRGADERT